VDFFVICVVDHAAVAASFDLRTYASDDVAVTVTLVVFDEQ